LAKISQLIDASREGRHQSKSSVVRGFVYSLRVIIQVVRLWFRDKCPQKASSLAFQSSLAMVPALGIALAALKISGSFDTQSRLIDYLASQILPDVERATIVKYVIEFTDNISLKTVGVPGLVGTLFVSFMLFYNVEEQFNEIWRIDRNRSIATKFLIFYCLITLVPPLLAYSVFHATVVTSQSPVAEYGLALGGTFAALFLANKLLPNTRVLFGPALVGSLVGAVFLEAAKLGFRLYVARVAFASYSGIYGRLGLVPILLVWIYLSWLILLLSAEVTHAMQNLPVLERERRRDLYGEAELIEKVNGVMAARLMLAVAQHYQEGGKAVRRADLCKRLDVSEDVVERIFRRLKERHIAIETEGEVLGYLPARPASEITLAQILSAFRSSDGSSLSWPQSPAANPRLEKILGAIDAETRVRTGMVSLQDLMNGEPVDEEVPAQEPLPDEPPPTH
jgi:membrane protein